MQTGESHLCRLVPCVLYLLLLIHLCLAAPGAPGSQREESADANSPSTALPNPFGSGEEDRRFLQSFIQSSLKDGQGGLDISTRDQELFFLFRIYDFDRSGMLDGLEMMKLLSDYNTQHTQGAQANDMVVSTVDFLLQTQDLNQDGLLAPSELLSPPSAHTQKDSSSDTAPHQEQEVEVEVALSNLSTHEETGAVDSQGGIQPREGDQPQHEVKTEEVELSEQLEENNGRQVQEVPADDQGHYEHAPVHQGQPEI